MQDKSKSRCVKTVQVLCTLWLSWKKNKSMVPRILQIMTMKLPTEPKLDMRKLCYVAKANLIVKMTKTKRSYRGTIQ